MATTDNALLRLDERRKSHFCSTHITGSRSWSPFFFFHLPNYFLTRPDHSVFLFSISFPCYDYLFVSVYIRTFRFFFFFCFTFCSFSLCSPSFLGFDSCFLAPPPPPSPSMGFEPENGHYLAFLVSSFGCFPILWCSLCMCYEMQIHATI